jgi:hypothetical protein
MTDELTVVCSLYKGWRPLYDFRNVNALQSMLSQYLKMPHRLVCMTDTPAGIRCETMPMWKTPEVKVRDRFPNCYKRLNLFRRDAEAVFGKRILSIDLDCLILRELDPLITDDDFRIVDGFSAPYNGSMFMLRSGSRPQVWDKFDPATSPKIANSQVMKSGRNYLGSDQAWISYIIPGEKVWGRSDGVYLFHDANKNEEILKAARVIFFPGLRKPWDPHMSKYSKIHHGYLKYM